MANETRPRREPTGTSRIRKTAAPSAPPAGRAGAARPRGGRRPIPARRNRRRRGDKSARPQGPRALPRGGPGRSRADPVHPRARSRAGPRAGREREPGLSVRERLARDRAERDGGPIHHDGIPMARDRDRDREHRCRP